MAKIKGQQYPSIPADGRIKTAWVPAIADIYAPTLDEIEAGVDISCAITMGGFTFSPSQATISDQRECTDQDFGRPGRKSVSDASVQLIDNTNSEIEADWNYAVEALAEGSEGYFVRRRGLPASTPWANGQTVTVIPAETGEKQMVAQDENTPQRSTIPFFVTAEWSVENSLIGGVKTVPATGLTLDNDTVNVIIGENATVTATPEPAHTTERLTATSNAEGTATVTVKGTTITIHGAGAGTATVTVTLGAITKTIQVTVAPKA